jgi:monoamine oxidase
MPPALTARIRFEPQLPALRDQLVQRFPMGSYAKFEAVYDHPFWRDDGTNGQAFGDLPVSATFDQSPSDGTPGIMAGFIGGEYARTWDQQDDATRRKLVLESLAQYFGPRMLQPIDYAEGRWTNELWSRGDPVGFAPPGVLLSFGKALRTPVGRIHWAGTETADYWIGYMDGAVRSGQRAAAEVIGQP